MMLLGNRYLFQKLTVSPFFVNDGIFRSYTFKKSRTRKEAFMKSIIAFTRNISTPDFERQSGQCMYRL